MKKTLLRYSTLLSLGVSPCLWPQEKPAGEPQSSCRAFVQEFYDWYVPRAAKERKQPAFVLVLKYKESALSSDLFRSLKEDSEAQAKAVGDIVGLDFDPFLYTQDPANKYAVGEVTAKNGSCSATVRAATSGRRKQEPAPVAELALKDGHWQFVNFNYPEGQDLRTVLKQLRAERLEPSKK
jgi:hypothetical protein